MTWSCLSARVRAILLSIKALVAVAVLTFVPVPDQSGADGVIWAPDEALVRATASGVVATILASPGAHVRRGQPLFTLRNEVLMAQVFETDMLPGALGASADGEVPDLTVSAGTDGTFVVARPEELPGRHVRRGEVVGHVVDVSRITVRAIVSHASIDLVRDQTRAVDVRLADRPAASVPAVIRRIVPSATDTTLGASGAGDESHPEHARVFVVDVELQQVVHPVHVGRRAFVVFHHGRAPLARQWHRKLRELVLARAHA
jgi:putative peptide zinc metalloprotease protein